VTDSGPTDLGALLGHLSFHQILAVPRRVDATDAEGAASGARAPARRSQGSDAMRAGLLAALIGAHSEGSPVAVAWVRSAAPVPADVSPIEVYVGGEPAFGDENASPGADPDAAVPILFPAGGRGKHVAPGHVIGRLTALDTWTRCCGTVDSHFVAPDDSPAGMYRAPFEEYIMSLPRQAFAWLVVAEPLGLSAVHTEMARLRKRMYDAKRSEKDAFEVERIEARHQELSRARATGLWRVHVLVGTPTARETRRVAALLCGGSDLARQPYILVPGTETCRFVDITACESTVVDGPSSPFDATTDLLATIGRPPEQEMPGVRIVNLPTFDLTPESPKEGIRLGDVLDTNIKVAGPIYVSKSTLNRHAFVCGATGSGKSQTVRALLEELAVAGIPWLVIEPAKAEYSRMAGRLEERAKPEYARTTGQVAGERTTVHVLRPGDPKAVPASLNPLEPEPGFPLQTHVDLVRALFLAAFEAEEPFPQVLAAALTRCYTDLGWELALGKSKMKSVIPRYPMLGDLQRTAKVVVEGIGYGREVTDNVRGFVDVRIGSLRLGTPGRFFEGGHPLDVGALLQRNVVIEIEDVGSDEDKAFLIGTVLIRLVEHLRVRHGSSEDPTLLSHVTVLEEAHRLLKNARPGTPAAHAVELFAGLLAEIRAYGEGIIVAEQIPSKVLPDVVKNTALKVMHRLPAQDDRESVGATMNLDREQSRYVVTLPPGIAAIFVDGMDRPILARMPLGEDWETARPARHDVPLARVRGPGCGTACRGVRPCTLEQIVTAVQLAENDEDDGARLAAWIELIVAAHLIGLTTPTPEPRWLGHVNAHPRRQVECAIGYAAQVAVDTRYGALIRFFQPEALITHARDCALATLDGAAPPCSSGDVAFQAGPYRWMDVRRELENAIEDGMEGVHPLSEDWRDARKLTLSGDTLAAQLESLWQVPEMRLSSDAVIFGMASPSRFEALLMSLSNVGEQPQRLREAFDHLNFGDYFWPADYLATRVDEPST